MSHNPAMSEKYFRRQTKYWLVAAAVVAVAWLLIWLTASAPAIIKKQASAEEEVEQVELPTRIDNFVDLAKEVKPIDFSTLVRDMRSYPPEFKDKIYFENIANRYTVEVMDVSENEIISNYLDGRSDRDQYAYFRYLDENKKPRYILTYGKFADSAEASASIAKADFGLPSSITTKTMKISDYLTKIDNYMRADSVADLSSSQPRRINLMATKNEIPVQAATRADEALAQRSVASAQARQQEEMRRQQQIETARAQLNQEKSAVDEQVTRSYVAPTENTAPQNNPEPVQEAAPKPPTVQAPTAKPEAKPEPKPEPKPANTTSGAGETEGGAQ